MPVLRQWSAPLRVLLLVALVVIPVTQVAHAQAAPAPTTSRYMTTIDGGVLYNEGCAQGHAADNGIAILDFGQPWFQNGEYGTILFDAVGSFASTAQIESA